MQNNNNIVRREIIIGRHNGAGNMWLCADGSLSSNIEEACFHWESQFEAILKEAWILSGGGIAFYAYTGK